MAEQPQYIFRSGELFVVHDTTLPGEIPEEFADLVLDSIELPLRVVPRACLLKTPQTSVVVSASVSNAGSSRSPRLSGLAASRARPTFRVVGFASRDRRASIPLASLAGPASRALVSSTG
jgi:hypothetical protein